MRFNQLQKEAAGKSLEDAQQRHSWRGPRVCLAFERHSAAASGPSQSGSKLPQSKCAGLRVKNFAKRTPSGNRRAVAPAEGLESTRGYLECGGLP